jgi:SNF2 family DNA or RNA helicase
VSAFCSLRDEFEKFAPHLNVLIYHVASGSSSVQNSLKKGKLDLSGVDVLINTTTTKFPPWLQKVKKHHFRAIFISFKQNASFTKTGSGQT